MQSDFGLGKFKKISIMAMVGDEGMMHALDQTKGGRNLSLQTSAFLLYCNITALPAPHPNSSSASR